MFGAGKEPPHPPWEEDGAPFSGRGLGQGTADVAVSGPLIARVADDEDHVFTGL